MSTEIENITLKSVLFFLLIMLLVNGALFVLAIADMSTIGRASVESEAEDGDPTPEAHTIEFQPISITMPYRPPPTVISAPGRPW
ncbi:MAG: hypothetical protein QNK24_10345 [Desulfuromusa sp.]|nr:hypothetical protein [Desulfuromusa sp.]